MATAFSSHGSVASICKFNVAIYSTDDVRCNLVNSELPGSLRKSILAERANTKTTAYTLQHGCTGPRQREGTMWGYELEDYNSKEW